MAAKSLARTLFFSYYWEAYSSWIAILVAQKMNELRGEERLIGGKEMLEFKSFIGKNVGTLGSLLFKLTDHVFSFLSLDSSLENEME